MSEELNDEQSHYEISLTAGQAFVAFVLLLLSLAASFTFGLMIGKGQGDERLVVRKEPAVVTEAAGLPRKTAGKIVELGVADQDFAKTPADTTDTTDTSGTAPLVTGGTETPSAATSPATTTGTAPQLSTAVDARVPEGAAHPAEARPVSAAPQVKPAEPKVALVPRWGVVYAQLLSTSDQKTAEALAARVINGGFTSAYVDRTTNEKGPVFRVRVKFDSDAEARAAEPKLREFSRDVWITK